MVNQDHFYHFILTRFNLLLWNKDKGGCKVRSKSWLEHRFSLFERYCLPSVKGQACQDFEWIVLFDNSTPEPFKHKIEEYKKECSQLIPIYVERLNGRCFAEIFRQEVVSRLKNQEYENERNSLVNTDDTNHTDKCFKRVLTTYLDNDDALHKDFIKDIQTRAKNLKFNTIISFQYGIQYYEEMNIAVRIPYKNNHFLTYYERLTEQIKTVWGFWHFSIFKYPHIAIELINNKNNPNWIETIHQGNIDNDVKMTLHHHLITNQNVISEFGITTPIINNTTAWYRFMCMFIPRFAKQIIRRIKNKYKN